ncbi:secretin N-terminal domain-containing protein, partial [Candidatus Similichlamydia epinepheli]|uniref:secretin N-terminal domain-containing protein n=1 Tax=Candidatus Similichlamydia epinepheli TaxID=1903953 RepID=UPI001300B6F1
MFNTQLPEKPRSWTLEGLSKRFLISSIFILQLLFPSWKWANTVPKLTTQEGYLVQFSDISLSEFVRFVSDITGHNFVYSEEDLKGRITLTAERQITSDELLNLLFRILHVNKMEVFKDNEHFLIFPLSKAKLVPPIFHSDEAIVDGNGLLATKVFHIQHANINKIRDLISKVVSPNALIEIFEETHSLIVNDIQENIVRIEELLENLDIDNFDLGFQTYFAKKMSADQLKEIADSVLPPFTKGFDMTIVASPVTQAVHIVAAKSLLPKVLSILKGIDIEGGLIQKTDTSMSFTEQQEERIAQTASKLIKNIEATFGEKIKEKKIERERLVLEIEKGQERIRELEEKIVAIEGHIELRKDLDEKKSSSLEQKDDEETKEEGKADEEDPLSPDDQVEVANLKEELNAVQLLYGTSKVSLNECDKEICALQDELVLVRKYLPNENVEEDVNLDVKPSSPSSNNQIDEDLEKDNFDPYAVRFEGMEELALLREELKEIQQLNKSKEEAKEAEVKQDGQILSYRIQYKNGKSLTDALKELSKNLSDNKLASNSLITALNSAQLIESNNQILFLGDRYTLERVQDI